MLYQNWARFCSSLQLWAGSPCPVLPQRRWGYCIPVGFFWHPSQAPLAASFHTLSSKCATSSLRCPRPSDKWERGFALQSGNRRKLRKIKKIVSHTYAVCHVFKREQVSEMFWLPSQKCTALEDGVQGSHVGGQNSPHKLGGGFSE